MRVEGDLSTEAVHSPLIPDGILLGISLEWSGAPLEKIIATETLKNYLR